MKQIITNIEDLIAENPAEIQPIPTCIINKAIPTDFMEFLRTEVEKPGWGEEEYKRTVNTIQDNSYFTTNSIRNITTARERFEAARERFEATLEENPQPKLSQSTTKIIKRLSKQNIDGSGSLLRDLFDINTEVIPPTPLPNKTKIQNTKNTDLDEMIQRQSITSALL